MYSLLIVLLGLTAFLTVLGLAGLFFRQLQRDTDWVSENVTRFTPEEVPVRFWGAVYTIAKVSSPLLLLAVLHSVVIALAAWFIILFFPHQVVEAFWKMRRTKIDLQLPVAISSMASNLSAGLSLVQSIQRLADRAPEPVRTEFKIMAHRYALGISLDQTLLEAKHRLDLPNFNLFVSALLINREMGGDVGIALDRISRSIEKLNQMRQTVRASTAAGRMNIKVLMFAPLAMLIMMHFMDPEGVNLLFSTPQGIVLLVIAGGFTFVGLFWASKIVGQDL
jgi:tight adherence protein B